MGLGFPPRRPPFALLAGNIANPFLARLLASVTTLWCNSCNFR